MSTLLVDLDTGKPLPPAEQEMMARFREQLLIVFVKRLGGKITVPVKETDDTGQDMMEMSVDQATGTFTFEVKKKQ